MDESEKISFWYCDKCRRTLLHGEFRYNCTVCEDFDYCEHCFTTTNSPHPHKMMRELAYGIGGKKRSPKKNTATMIRLALANYSDRYCMGTRDVDKHNPALFTDSYSWLTFKTIGNRAKNFGHGLRRLIQPHQYLSICAANRPEWIITDFACIFQGIVSVPIYTLFTKDEIAYVINNTQVSVVVCDKEMLPRFVEVHAQCPTLKHLICMDVISDLNSVIENLGQISISIHFMEEIEKGSIINHFKYVHIQPDDCLTIIYTSGSSGFPKGAIISESAFRATFPSRLTSSSLEYIHFSYQPLAWAADRDAVILTLLHGGRIAFSSGNPSHLMEELALVRPTDFSAAPIIWNKIYTEFETALALSFTQCSSDNRSDVEQRLLQEFSKLMPNRCKFLVIGGAMVSSFVLNFVKRCFIHCSILESYGTTECGSITYDNVLDDGVEYRLESVPEMGYTLDDQPYPRGELLTKTPQMFSGYINDPHETQAALTHDGFFRTGDIVELHTDQNNQTHIYIIDRKKNFFKLAQGQFVSPEHLQNLYLQSPFVQQIYIHGDLLSHSVSAVVVPNHKYALAFAQQHSLSNFDTNHPHPQFSHALKQDLHRIAQQEQLRKHEIPSHIVIDFQPFTSENGLLTSSMKLCRHKLAKYYADRLQPPSSDDIEQRLRTIIETVTGRVIDTDNEENQTLVRVGGDSMSTIRLSRTIENELGILLPLDVLLDPSMTLQQLTALIQHPSSLSTLSSSSSIEAQLLKDAHLNFDIKVNGHKPLTKSPSLIFVSGTTGFVGSFLLAELLSTYSNECKCLCLVRCDDVQMNPLDRIREKMLFYNIWKDEYEERIVAIRGDLSKDHFGWDDQTYQSFVDQVNVIYHCGAMVNFIYPYSQLYGANVCGSREVIRFATWNSSCCIPIEYISTISVLSEGNDQEVALDERSVVGLKTGYAQSKWVAERLMNAASQCGVIVNIYRLGLMIGDSRSGACNEHALYSLLFGGMMKMRCYPESAGEVFLYGLPVDFAVKSIVYLSGLKRNESGRICHVVNTKKKMIFEDVLKGMVRCGIEMKSVTNAEWKMKLRTFTKKDTSFGCLDQLFSDDELKSNDLVSADRFWDAVKTKNYPIFNQDYVSKWLRCILDRFQ